MAGMCVRVLAAALENALFILKPKGYFGFLILHGWHAKETRYLVGAAEKFRKPVPAVTRGCLWLRG
jgi:hypothetical protein